MAMPKNYFEGTEFTDSIANEKRALLALIAERGSEGQAAYDRASATAAETRAGGLEKAAARGAAVNAPPALQAGLVQNYDQINNAYRDALAQSQLGHGREMDRIAYANSAYKEGMIAQQPQFQSAMDAQIRALQLEMAARAGGGGGGGGGSSGGGLAYPGQEPAITPEELKRVELADPYSGINLYNNQGIDELQWLTVPTNAKPGARNNTGPLTGSVGGSVPRRVTPPASGRGRSVVRERPRATPTRRGWVDRTLGPWRRVLN